MPAAEGPVESFRVRDVSGETRGRDRGGLLFPAAARRMGQRAWPECCCSESRLCDQLCVVRARRRDEVVEGSFKNVLLEKK